LFLLCVYIDSERWSSALEPLLYPTGISFYRPFSYRATYFYPEQITTQLSDRALSEALLGQEGWNQGFFGIRFSAKSGEPFPSKFVPLRKVSLLSAHSGETLNLNFRLGPYVAPHFDTSSGKKLFETLDLSGVLTDLAVTKLFIELREVEKEKASKWRLSDKFPDGFWEAFESEMSPTALGLVRGAVLLRLAGIQKRGAANPLSPAELDTNHHVWGYELQEGTAYDLALSHFRIVQSGAQNSPLEYQYRVSNPREEMSTSRRFIPIQGNYRADDVWISPQLPGPGPTDISIEPCKLEKPEAMVDPAAAKVLGLKIPILVKARTWTAERWIDLAIFILGLSIGGALFYLYSRPGTAESMQKLLLVIIAAAVSLALNSLKSLIVRKH
jgi:hypothetical protein